MTQYQYQMVFYCLPPAGQDGTLQSFSAVHERFNKSLGHGEFPVAPQCREPLLCSACFLMQTAQHTAQSLVCLEQQLNKMLFLI